MSYAEQEWAMAQASIQYQQHIDQGMDAAYGPPVGYEGPYGPYFPDLTHDPAASAQEPEPEQPTLLDDQEEAYEYLLRHLSEAQRDALLVLSMKSGANALDQLLDNLWNEWDREQRNPNSKARD